MILDVEKVNRFVILCRDNKVNLLISLFVSEISYFYKYKYNLFSYLKPKYKLNSLINLYPN